MLALAQIGVLVEVRAVEVAEGKTVLGKMGWHPVQDHADPILVAGVHERHEILGRPVAAGWREVARHLVAPRGVQRVLGHRHQLQVRVAHLAGIGDQLIRQFAVGEKGVPVLAPPRAEMHLVDRHRALEGAPRRARAHPRLVAPLVPVQVGHDRRRAGAQLRVESVRIGLLDVVAVRPRAQVVFVRLAHAHAGDEQLPDAAVRVIAHGMHARVPAVEAADHAHAVGVGRPHGEPHARHTVQSVRVRAELLVALQVAALAEQVQVIIGEHRREGIRIDERLALALVGHDLHAVARRLCRGGNGGLEEAFVAQAVHGDCLAGSAEHHRRRAGAGAKHANRERAVARRVRAQEVERRAVLAVDQGCDRVGVKIGCHRLLSPP